jgi:hypothetical protein
MLGRREKRLRLKRIIYLLGDEAPFLIKRGLFL